jgi:hypothetical protein
MSPAEELRLAAKLMRENAGAATPGAWAASEAVDGEPVVYVPIAGSGARVLFEGDWGTKADADHIASWHPLPALAVADWLDEEAADYEGHESAVQRFVAGLNGGNLDPALVVARAYLGTDASPPVVTVTPAQQAAARAIEARGEASGKPVPEAVRKIAAAGEAQ